MTNLTDLTLAEARDALKAKKISAVELTDAHLKSIDAQNPKLNAYITVTHDLARERAKTSDAKLIFDNLVGLVDGILFV